MSRVLSIQLPRDELNRNFGGGMPENSLILIEGKDGSGKSILSQRIAYGLLEHGHTITYISSELNLRGFVEQMDSLNYHITEKILDEKVIFIPIFPQIGNVKLKKTFMNDLLRNKKVFQSDVIIFDTLSFLLVNDDVTKENSFELVSFIKKLNAMSKTIIFCVNHEQLNPTFLSILRSVVDVYLQTEARMVLGNLLRIITVIRFNKCAGEVITATPFKVIPGQGFALELASLS
ncbi:MAG TPA: ATPase domain-containing protein [Acidobacteriota bacterium]|nr:ATPase domain-containing protein [Acidobacteriota bacterium]